MKDSLKYRIGILGAGYIGRLLANKLSAAGHIVKVAQSGNPDSINKIATATDPKTNPDSDFGVRVSRALFF